MADDKPLEVYHKLWVKELQGVSWCEWKGLVKAAKRRVNPK